MERRREGEKIKGECTKEWKGRIKERKNEETNIFERNVEEYLIRLTVMEDFVGEKRECTRIRENEVVREERCEVGFRVELGEWIE